MPQGPQRSPFRRLLAPAAIGVVLIGGGCANEADPGRSDAEARTVAPPVRFLAGTALDPDRLFEGTRIGGLSSLSYDAERAELLALSDIGLDSRLYVFDLTVDEASIEVVPRAIVRLLGPEGRPLDTDLDSEGMALSASDTILVASEGGRDAKRELSPAVYEFTRDGRLVGALSLPEKFRLFPTGADARGVRFNRAFESLTLAPSGNRLFTATESALLQDTPSPAAQDGMLCRILEYERRSESFEPTREWAYRIEPPAVPDDFEASTGENGLVELLALSDTELLALERSFVVEAGVDSPRLYQRIRLYRISTDDATNVSGRNSLVDPITTAPVEKTLMLDFGDDTARPADLIVDNYEGLAFGPVLEDGSRTIILVSDDNFSERQQTVFLLFGLEE